MSEDAVTIERRKFSPPLDSTDTIETNGHPIDVEHRSLAPSSILEAGMTGHEAGTEPDLILSDGVVHLWTAGSEDFPADTEGLLESLPEADRRRADGIRAEKRRRQFVHGRILLRSLLDRYLGSDAGQMALDILPHGKPVACAAAGAGVHFNLSHSGELVALAFSGAGPVGLDVETVRAVPQATSIARGFFTDNERAWLESMPDESSRSQAFLSLWTCKEAVAKATGRGISAGWHEFEIARDEQNLRVVPTNLPTGGQGMGSWALIQPATISGYVAAIAVPRPVTALVFAWPTGKRTG